MYVCAVKGCDNYRAVCNIGGEQHLITMHSFPKDPERRQKWIDFCAQDKTISPSARICSEHFQEEDYIRTVVYLGCKSVRHLKKSANPSRFEPIVRCDPRIIVEEERVKGAKHTINADSDIELVHINPENFVAELGSDYESFVQRQQDNTKSTKSFNKSASEKNEICLDEFVQIFQKKQNGAEKRKIFQREVPPAEPTFTQEHIPAKKKRQRETPMVKAIPCPDCKPNDVCIVESKSETVEIKSPPIQKIESNKIKTAKVTDSLSETESFLVDELENIVLDKIKKKLAELRLENEKLEANVEVLHKKRKELEAESEAIKKDVNNMQKRIDKIEENKKKLLITNKNSGEEPTTINAIDQLNPTPPIIRPMPQDFGTEFEQFLRFKN